MRFIIPIVEQLNRAASELGAGHPLNSRVAVILIDNALELMCHQKCADILERDRHGNTPTIAPADRAAARGRAFDQKLKFLTKQAFLTQSDARSIAILHAHRNELYHVGLRDDPVIACLARYFFAVTLRMLVALFSKERHLRWEAEVASPVVKDLIPELRLAKRTSCRIDLAALIARLAACLPATDIDFAPALGSHLHRLVDKVEADFNFIAGGRSGRDDPDETLRSIQLEEDTIREIVRRKREQAKILKSRGLNAEPFDSDRLSLARGTNVLRDLNAKLTPDWQPRHKSQPFAAWRKQAAGIQQERSEASALDKYHRLHTEIDGFDELLAEPVEDMHGWHQHQEDMAMDRR